MSKQARRWSNGRHLLWWVGLQWMSVEWLLHQESLSRSVLEVKAVLGCDRGSHRLVRMKRVLEVSLLAELWHCNLLELIIDEKHECLKILPSCRTLAGISSSGLYFYQSTFKIRIYVKAKKKASLDSLMFDLRRSIIDWTLKARKPVCTSVTWREQARYWILQNFKGER